MVFGVFRNTLLHFKVPYETKYKEKNAEMHRLHNSNKHVSFKIIYNPLFLKFDLENVINKDALRTGRLSEQIFCFRYFLKQHCQGLSGKSVSLGPCLNSQSFNWFNAVNNLLREKVAVKSLFLYCNFIYEFQAQSCLRNSLVSDIGNVSTSLPPKKIIQYVLSSILIGTKEKLTKLVYISTIEVIICFNFYNKV